MTKPSVDALESLFGQVVTELGRRIAGDEASAADISNAIKLLKDNNITAVVADNSALTEMEKKLEAMRAKRGTPVVAVPSTPAPLSEQEQEDAIDFAMSRDKYGS